MHVPDNDDDSYTVSLGIGPQAEDGQSQSTLLEVQSLQSGVSVGMTYEMEFITLLYTM